MSVFTWRGKGKMGEITSWELCTSVFGIGKNRPYGVTSMYVLTIDILEANSV